MGNLCPSCEPLVIRGVLVHEADCSNRVPRNTYCETCYEVETEDHDGRVLLCPLHAAAKELVAMLQKIVHSNPGSSLTPEIQVILTKIEKGETE